MFDDIIKPKNKEEEFLSECPICGAGYDGYVCPFCFFENRPPKLRINLKTECKDCPVKGIECDRCV